MLFDAEGNETDSMEIADFNIPANSSKTAVQTRAMSAEDWNKVDDYEVQVDE